MMEFILAVLVTWRVTHLFALEDGPAEVVVWLRRRLGNGWMGHLMDCFYCLSLWVAAPVALLVAHGPLHWAMDVLALSGAACLLERLGATPERKRAPMQPAIQSAIPPVIPPVVPRVFPPEGESNVLRQQTIDPA